MIKLITHQEAQSAEFLAGCPGEWPRTEEVVSDDYKLSEKELESGYILETERDHAARIEQHREAFRLWEDSQKTAEHTVSQAKRQELADSLANVRTVEDSTGNLTLAQLSNAVRALAKQDRLVAKALKELFDL